MSDTAWPFGRGVDGVDEGPHYRFGGLAYDDDHQPRPSPFPEDISGMSLTMGWDDPDITYRSVAVLPPPLELGGSVMGELEVGAPEMYIEHGKKFSRAPPSPGTGHAAHARESVAVVGKEGLGKPAAAELAPEVPPYFGLERTHFVTGMTALAAGDLLEELFRTNSIDVQWTGFRLKCSAYVGHRETAFNVSLFRGDGAGPASTIIQFQRWDGCSMAFNKLYRSVRQAFKAVAGGSPVQPGDVSAAVAASLAPPPLPHGMMAGRAGARAGAGAGGADGKGEREGNLLDRRSARALAGGMNSRSEEARRESCRVCAAIAAAPSGSGRALLDDPELAGALEGLLHAEGDPAWLPAVSAFANLSAWYRELGEGQRAWVRASLAPVVAGLGRHKDPHAQREAARALASLSGVLPGQIKSLGGTESLTAAYRSQDVSCRGYASEALKNIEAF